MRKIDISKRAAKVFRKLPTKQARQVATKMQSLRGNAEPSDSLQLKGHAPLRRADIGEYRIIYFADSETLHIVLIGK